MLYILERVEWNKYGGRVKDGGEEAMGEERERQDKDGIISFIVLVLSLS